MPDPSPSSIPNPKRGREEGAGRRDDSSNKVLIRLLGTPIEEPVPSASSHVTKEDGKG